MTARYALQTLGTEWSRNCDPLTWPRKLVQVYEQLQNGGVSYHPRIGLQCSVSLALPSTNVVVCGVRFRNEIEYIRTNGGFTVLVERRVEDFGNALNEAHPSEVDLNSMLPSQFSEHIINYRTLAELAEDVEKVFHTLSSFLQQR